MIFEVLRTAGNSLKMYLIVHVKYLQCLNNSYKLEGIANKENKISERRVSNASLLNLFLNSRSSISFQGDANHQTQT